MNNSIPVGFKLRHVLQGHKGEINRFAWSLDGRFLASPSDDFTIRFWDLETGKLCQKPINTNGLVHSVAWSPNGQILASGGTFSLLLWDTKTGKLKKRLTRNLNTIKSVTLSSDGLLLASGSDDKTVQIWDVTKTQLVHILKGHSGDVNSVAWSPDDTVLASGSDDGSIQLWSRESGQLLKKLSGRFGKIRSVTWSPDGQTIAASSTNQTIQLWEYDSGSQKNILEGHTDAVISISFSFDGRLLASKSHDGTIRIWRTDTWETIAILDEPSSNKWIAGLAFHPKEPILATLDEHDYVIRIWDIDIDTILSSSSTATFVYYTNAKVVLVGDTGVGKTGLSLVLTNQPFIPTVSTHGHYVWNFDSQRIELNNGRKETREILLWDLAGQPGYRLIHQLHLNDVAVALVVFDSRSETDPFAGVHHWDRALRVAQRLQYGNLYNLKKLLVAARIDRGGISASQSRIESLLRELAFDGYIETSAKEGQNIPQLSEMIKNAINWDTLPMVSSTELFQQIKTFLINEKQARHILSTREDLFDLFLKTEKADFKTVDLRAQFETCITLVESQGLIRKLSFGHFILLQPELLDAYASSLINAVKDEPDGLGSILEESAQRGLFFIPKDERLENNEQERLLLIAMIEDLLRFEIALREYAEDGSYLVFPSQSTRENPDLPDPRGEAVVFSFEGPILNIYTTLAVRLSHSGMFRKKELWRDAVTYDAKLGGMCGIYLRNRGEGRGELTIFFDERTSEETRFHFEEYVQTHLNRRALPESILRQRVFVCPNCSTPFTNQQIVQRQKLGFSWIKCNVCDTTLTILDREERLTITRQSILTEMDRTADKQRDLETATSVIQGKITTNDFDVFMCYNEEDEVEVKKIGAILKEQGILPWIAAWEMRPGLPWQRLLENQIERIKSVAVFVGEDEIGPWQRQEVDAFLREFVERNCPVIPVLLANALKKPRLPLFLRGMMWIDFRKQDPNPIEQLIWGITGERSRL